jgi:hypothetical protein
MILKNHCTSMTDYDRTDALEARSKFDRVVVGRGEYERFHGEPFREQLRRSRTLCRA